MPHNPNVGRTWATIRLTDADLDPADVTRRLGIEPTTAFRRGDAFGRGFARTLGSWELTSEGQVATNDLEEHLAWLLDRIEPTSGPFNAVRADGIDADIFCFLETRGHGGPTFSPHLMGRLAALELVLGLDIYCAEDDE